MFSALKRVGVRLALDDFGTGYSSLGYLKKAPFDKIKIDQGFVRGATAPGSRNGAIIASIVSLAEALGMETTAEGVETLDELELVTGLKCSHVQGYVFGKPLPRDEATARLADGGVVEAHGPRSAREARRTMLRRVSVEAQGETYPATIRNISTGGAMFEGCWMCPWGWSCASCWPRIWWWMPPCAGAAMAAPGWNLPAPSALMRQARFCPRRGVARNGRAAGSGRLYRAPHRLMRAVG
jgi:hypothetical protein